MVKMARFILALLAIMVVSVESDRLRDTMDKIIDLSKDFDCQQKGDLFDQVLAAAFSEIERDQSVELPELSEEVVEKFRSHGFKISEKIRELNPTCEEKAKQFDVFISKKGKYRLKIMRKKDRKMAKTISQVLKQARKATKNMNCEEKNRILDLVLDNELEKVVKELKIDATFPPLPKKLPAPFGEMAQAAKPKFSQLTCEEKAATFDRLLKGDFHGVYRDLFDEEG